MENHLGNIKAGGSVNDFTAHGDSAQVNVLGTIPFFEDLEAPTAAGAPAVGMTESVGPRARPLGVSAVQ